ncbi:Ca2+-binding RTX toxin-like protein [Rhizobium sp. SG_E_25_P2]|uniref:M10 family metallopeptidase C-terminal domain-containing protein n=1 Tax=Rhizobium sp. SG_E_25_P2 TaxID=2879942 RepID=UPI002476C620|nr:M10 family metallopeptidase C-terminal domain-containing protein [Rhizobium sp. SG_E_25_P2]MDH6266927.1 Ca2+-binding RTX toxin-like protein [Rhizobium sp. SG_E_25_P2]
MADPYKVVALSGNAVIDGLLNGAAWSKTKLTYSFGASDINSNGVPDMDEGDWKPFYRQILDNVESFTKLRFTEVASSGNINFLLFEGGGGESGVPGPGATSVTSSVGINSDVAGAADAVKLGTFSLTWIHEFGHALGFKHPHDTETGPAMPGVDDPASHGTGEINSQISTVMGYTTPYLGEDNPFTVAVDVGAELNAQPGSFGAIDIAALQYMYGKTAHNAADTVYRFSDDVDFNNGYTTIWDTGGVDEIRYVGSSRAKIDLRAATLKAEIGGGGWVSTSETLTGGYTIANGVSIEKATGGSKADILIGNGLANTLSGLGGGDTLQGGRGQDRLSGGSGADIFVFKASGSSAKMAAADIITDFGTRDVLDFTAFGSDIDRDLTFVGDKGFSGDSGEIRLRRQADVVFVEADLDGDKLADFRVRLANGHDPVAANFDL